jgi:hypothetical protein
MWSELFSPGILGSFAIFVGYGFTLSARAPSHYHSGRTAYERTVRGKTESLGGGTVQSFVTRDLQGRPVALGVTVSRGALEQLPQSPNTVSRCFDMDGNGTHTGHECIGDLERILDVPVAASSGLPFKWITVNWNAGGHPAPYDRPHFDFHFYTADRGLIEGITPGRCGELVDCGHFKRASEPLPARHLPKGHISVGAVVPRMGNHLLDSQSPELKDSLPFTRTFIYGAYEGELIFWEPMITLDFLLKTQEACFAISQPEGFRRAGFYPTQYCVRQGPEGQRTVSLEKFRYAHATT